MIQFELPSNRSSIIKVIGVGGGGGNAVNYMHSLGMEGVDFVVCNTDMKALQQSNVPNKVQLGPSLTQGLGAGANPVIGQQACEESMDEISSILKENTKMVFVTAGMGGGTGTGAAPIVSKLAKDHGVLTVGIVTTPFSYEGKRRMQQAEEGIAKMRENVDTILVISNDKLREQYGNLPFRQAFSKADDILATATKCITDVINSTGHIIVDFADVCRVMRDGGVAILGNADATGENRAQLAVEKALNSPLLNDNNIQGAKWVLLNINSAEGEFEHTIDEMVMIQEYVQSKAGKDCDVILGTGYDKNLGDKISVTIIATGFKVNNTDTVYSNVAFQTKEEDPRIFVNLNDEVDNTASVTDTVASDIEPLNTLIDVSDHAEKIHLNLIEEEEELIIETPLMQTQAEEIPEAETNEVVEEVKIEAAAIPLIPAMSFRPQVQKNVDDLSITSVETVMNNEPELLILPVTSNENTQQVVENEIVELSGASDAEVQNEKLEIDLYSEQITENKSIEINANEKVVIELDANIDEVKSELETPAYRAESQSLKDDFITVKGITINRRVGNRYMTEFEIEDKVNFELQKKYFEERASKLRSMSSNINTGSSKDDLENVPAYQRKGADINAPLEGNENALSSYTVSKNSINSQNSFLEGDRAD